MAAVIVTQQTVAASNQLSDLRQGTNGVLGDAVIGTG
jgi:hypothetical protein